MHTFILSVTVKLKVFLEKLSASKIYGNDSVRA